MATTSTTTTKPPGGQNAETSLSELLAYLTSPEGPRHTSSIILNEQGRTLHEALCDAYRIINPGELTLARHIDRAFGYVRLAEMELRSLAARVNREEVTAGSAAIYELLQKPVLDVTRAAQKLALIHDLPIYPTPRLAAALEGGLVSSIVADQPCDVAVIDYDTESVDPEDLMPIPQRGLPGHVPPIEAHDTDAYARFAGVEVDPGRVEELHNAVERGENKEGGAS